MENFKKVLIKNYNILIEKYKSLSKEKKQILLLFCLLLFVSISNYYWYYMPKDVLPLQFEKLPDWQKKRITEQSNKSTFEAKKELEEEVAFHATRNINTDDLKYGDNYLNYAVDYNGKIVKWNKRIINVYIYPSNFDKAIKNGINIYNKLFKDYFRFNLIQDPNKADINISMVDKFDINDNVSKKEPLMSGLTNNYFSSDEKYLRHSDIKLLFFKPNTRTVLSENGITLTLLHELGHAIGIIGHSPNPRDIMHQFMDKNPGYLTQRDRVTIKMMYSNDNALIQRQISNYKDTKLKEAKMSVEKMPKNPLAFANLARVKFEQGEKEEALNLYKKALMLDSKNPDVYSSMGECYYLSKNYNAAIKYFKKAYEYSNDDSAKAQWTEIIGVSYAKSNDYVNAYEMFKSAYYSNRKNVKYLDNLLIACLQLNKNKEAKEFIADFKAEGGDVSQSKIINSLND